MKHARLAAAFCAALLALAPAAGAQPADRFLVAETIAPNPEGNVLEVAAAAGQFTHFLEAVEAVGYAETLRGEGPFTVFAPTDLAIRQMDQAEWRRLMEPRNRDELLALLAYHVVAERITTESAGARVTRPEAASGFRLTLDGRDGLRVNDTLVALPDMEASNGVLHGVNTVLAPPVMIASR
jgi:uncharacterized surface protein with fasciclin (FAS1) repeats